MSRLSKIFTLLAIGAIAAILSRSDVCEAGKPKPNPIPMPHWEFHAELGGWLDYNTGLVWGENTYDYFYDRGMSSYSNGSWDWINSVLLPEYRSQTGFNDWRFPSNAELQQAAAEKFTDYAFPGGVTPWTNPVVTWTSEGSGIWRYYGELTTGEVQRTIQANSSINLTPVRRAW